MQTVLAFMAQAASAVGGAVSSAGSAIASTFSSAGTATAVAGSGEAAATAASTAATAAADAGVTTAASTAATAASWGSKILGALKTGTSVVSALSLAGEANMKAEAMRQAAQDENMQARNSFIQGLQNANDIEQQYNEVVQRQMALAEAGGIDVGSGSVTEARQQARADADRQLTITRNGIGMNAAIRRGRAAYLGGAADLTQQTGDLAALAKVGNTAIDVSRLG